MSRKDKEPNRAKGATDRRASDKDLKKTGRVNQASNGIRPAQEIADDEVAIAKTGAKP
ncbi:MAG TPA: hypothetical protein VNE82_08540 [Candidatus Binataceae bacterium]|nr:hypothetical protein [Candidatus Binataceae bacterium]